jgi:hypothetical protein
VIYKVEVQVYGEKSFCGNGICFATRDEAEAYGLDLFTRWTAVEEWKVVEVVA